MPILNEVEMIKIVGWLTMREMEKYHAIAAAAAEACANIAESYDDYAHPEKAIGPRIARAIRKAAK